MGRRRCNPLESTSQVVVKMRAISFSLYKPDQQTLNPSSPFISIIRVSSYSSLPGIKPSLKSKQLAETFNLFSCLDYPSNQQSKSQTHFFKSKTKHTHYQDLIKKMDKQRFIIEAKEAESMAKDSGFETVAELLPSLVKSARKLARPPISKFHVGAVGLGSDGRVYFGGNLEFPYLPLHHSVHAEQFLITNANINGEKPVGISHIAISATPCGHCRQFMQEIRRAGDIEIMSVPSDHSGIEDSGLCFHPLSSMLSDPFGPADLLEKDVPLLLEAHNNGLVLVDSVKRNGIHNENGIHGEDEEVWMQLKNCALEAANKCHAPYSKCASGVALMDSAGKVYKGSYTESAAYNPSLGPVQAALIAYVSGGIGGGGYEKIVAGVLVEKKGAVIRQESTAKLLLEAISPQCAFRVFHCDSSMN